MESTVVDNASFVKESNMFVRGNDCVITGNDCTIFGHHCKVWGAGCIIKATAHHCVVFGYGCQIYGEHAKICARGVKIYARTFDLADHLMAAKAHSEGPFLTKNMDEADDGIDNYNYHRSRFLLSSAESEAMRQDLLRGPKPPIVRPSTGPKSLIANKFDPVKPGPIKVDQPEPKEERIVTTFIGVAMIEKAAENGTTCIICLENRPNIMALECGHKKFCATCVKCLIDKAQPGKAVECPQCRQSVKCFMQVFED
jgi:hypothetical protein